MSHYSIKLFPRQSESIDIDVSIEKFSTMESQPHIYS